jgi:hypothetical protein
LTSSPLSAIDDAVAHFLRPRADMNLSPTVVFSIAAGAAAYLVLLWWLDRSLAGSSRVGFRYAAVIGTSALLFWGLGRLVDDYARAVDITKAMIAIAAAGCVFYEQHRAGARRPVSERWKRFVGITLGLAAIACYYQGFRFGYPKYFHRHDQYHYYMGAKYFPELGYDRLYKCSAIAQDELGNVEFTDDAGRRGRIDMAKEVRHPDRKIRNLGGDNLLMQVTEVLEHPAECKSHFSPERWEAYKADVKFFRLSSDKAFWQGMQNDHGYNPPPVWTVAGKFFADRFAAGHKILGFVWVQYLAMIDNVLVASMFLALWWAFGWRVFALGAVFWGCQSSAPALWTEGAFLRQDWLLLLVLAACLARKRWFALAGASLVYAGLLRVFPGLAVIGWLVVAGAHLVRHKRLAKHHQRMLLGGVLAAAVLIPVSIQVSGKDVYQQFFKHTLQVHDRTPLTNHMGLRVLVSHKLGDSAASGRMKYTKDDKLTDPFEVWKRMRNERYDRYRFVAYGIVALSLAFFVWVVRRVKSMWISLCLGQIFIILMSQLTCYYYTFLVLTAPLTRVKREIEVPLLGLAALSQFVWITLGYNDDKYTALTLLSLVFCYGLVCAFAARGSIARLLGRAEAPAAGAG